MRWQLVVIVLGFFSLVAFMAKTRAEIKTLQINLKEKEGKK